eukprot:Skav209024  [mRNA]  locus=scaffold2191:148377:166552:- [translate_table: standard]
MISLYFVGGGTMGGDGPTIQVCTALSCMIGDWVCILQHVSSRLTTRYHCAYGLPKGGDRANWKGEPLQGAMVDRAPTVAEVSCRFPGDTLEPVLISGAFLGAAIGRMLPEEVRPRGAVVVNGWRRCLKLLGKVVESDDD